MFKGLDNEKNWILNIFDGCLVLKQWLAIASVLFEEIHLKIGMTPIGEKMRNSCLRWFGQVQWRTINAPMRKSELI
jgi:hypothetical protein